MVVGRLIKRLRKVRKENAELRILVRDLEVQVRALKSYNRELSEKLAHKPKSAEESLEKIEQELVQARQARARENFDWDVGY